MSWHLSSLDLWPDFTMPEELSKYPKEMRARDLCRFLTDVCNSKTPLTLELLFALTDRHGQTVLHRAIAARAYGMLEQLLAFGADPQALNAQGQTPLHYAISVGDLVSFKILLTWNANKMVFGKSILHYLEDLKTRQTFIDALRFVHDGKEQVLNMSLYRPGDKRTAMDTVRIIKDAIDRCPYPDFFFSVDAGGLVTDICSCVMMMQFSRHTGVSITSLCANLFGSATTKGKTESEVLGLLMRLKDPGTKTPSGLPTTETTTSYRYKHTRELKLSISFGVTLKARKQYTDFMELMIARQTGRIEAEAKAIADQETNALLAQQFVEQKGGKFYRFKPTLDEQLSAQLIANPDDPEFLFKAMWQTWLYCQQEHVQLQMMEAAILLKAILKRHDAVKVRS